MFPDNISISTELRELIETMLDKVPAQRITLPQTKVIFFVCIDFQFEWSFGAKFNYQINSVERTYKQHF